MKKKLLLYFSLLATVTFGFSPTAYSETSFDIKELPLVNSNYSNSLNKDIQELDKISIRTYESEKINKLYISASDNALKYEISPMTSSDKLVIDTYGTTDEQLNKAAVYDSKIVADVKSEIIKETTNSPEGVRLYIYTKKDVDFNHTLISMNHTLEIQLFPKENENNFSFNNEKRTIVLDPGHGGNDPGAVGLYGTREKDINLSVSRYLKDMLEDNNINVIMTRDYDKEVYLQPRVDKANINSADIFISIHANASTSRTPQGSETYYKTPQSSLLSKVIHKNLIKELGSKDRGIKTGNFFVIKKTVMPSILMELGFVSNPQEEKLLASPAYQKKIASAIYSGIKQYFSLVQI